MMLLPKIAIAAKYRRTLIPPSMRLVAPSLPPQRRRFAEWNQRGHDLTVEALTSGNARPKIMLQGFAPTGFDVYHCIKRVERNSVDGTNDDNHVHDSAAEDTATPTSGTLHLHGSAVLAFPNGAFLWKVRTVQDLTVASLAPVWLHQPPVEYLLIGCHDDVPRHQLDALKAALPSMMVERLSLANAMGTFNILNAEDRVVAAALIRDAAPTTDS